MREDYPHTPLHNFPDTKLEETPEQKQSEAAFDWYSSRSTTSAGIVSAVLFIVLFLYTTNLSAQLRHRKRLEEPRRQMDAPAAAITRSRRGGGR